MEFNIEFLIVSISVAAFSIQVVISSLADKVKNLFGLNQTHRYMPLLNISAWTQIIGLKWSMILSPFILLVVAALNVHKFISEMVQCPFCISIWLMLAVNLLYFNLPVINSILYAPFVLVFVTLLDSIMSE